MSKNVYVSFSIKVSDERYNAGVMAEEDVNFEVPSQLLSLLPIKESLEITLASVIEKYVAETRKRQEQEDA